MVVGVGAVISEETLAIRLLCQGAGDRRARLDVGELALPLEATGASKVVGALLSQLRGRLCFDLALQSREAVGLGRLLLERRLLQRVAFALRVVVAEAVAQPLGALPLVAVAAVLRRADGAVEVRVKVDRVAEVLLRALNIREDLGGKHCSEQISTVRLDVEVEHVGVSAGILHTFALHKRATAAVTHADKASLLPAQDDVRPVDVIEEGVVSNTVHHMHRREVIGVLALLQRANGLLGHLEVRATCVSLSCTNSTWIRSPASRIASTMVASK